MNKTIVACVGIITIGLVTICISPNYYKYLSKAVPETRDRVTVCIDTVMARSIEAQQPIDVKLARDVCG